MALRQHFCVATGLFLSVFAVPATAVEGFEAQPAQIAPLAASTLLLDAVLVDGVYVAVGDRGHILTSSDAGETWQQQAVPTRSMLTAVWFHDRQTGWAVGHDALVLKTTDGGETWTPKHYAPDPEQPLFDVWFAEDGQRGLAVGAYGFLLSTEDGGETWQGSSLEATTWDPEAEKEAAEAEAGGEDDPAAEALADEAADDDEGYDDWDDVEGGVHLNKISKADDGTLWIGAEAGNLYRSDDGGETWLKIPTPYDGSFFGILPVGSSGVLAFGLRGNLFFTDDRGANWTRLETPETVSLNDAIQLEDGRIVIVGMAGTLLVGSPKAGFELKQQDDRKAIVQVLPADGSLLLFGEAGAVKIPVPAG